MKQGIMMIKEAMSPMCHNDNVKSIPFGRLGFILTNRINKVNLTYEKLK